MNKLLIVDDEYIIRSLLETMFQDDYELITAKDGEEAIQRIKEHKPKVVLLDLMMPKKSGYQVLREIKNNPETKECYVIVLTAKHQVSDVNIAVDVHADEFITKPFDPTILKNRIDLVFDCLNNNKPIKHGFKNWSGSLHYVKGR
jgi:DNA-binding response OmpR family regulator